MSEKPTTQPKTPTLAKLRKLAESKDVDLGINPYGHEYDIQHRRWRLNIQAENKDYAGLRRTVAMLLSALPGAKEGQR